MYDFIWVLFFSFVILAKPLSIFFTFLKNQLLVPSIFSAVYLAFSLFTFVLKLLFPFFYQHWIVFVHFLVLDM